MKWRYILPGIAILAVPFIYTNATLDHVLLPRFLVLSVSVLGFSGFLLLQAKTGKSAFDPGILRKSFFLFYLVYLTVAALSVFMAINTTEAVWEWLRTFVFFMFLSNCSLSLSAEEKPVGVIIRMTAVFTLIISFIGFYQFVRLDMDGITGHFSHFITSSFVNRNLYCQILFLTFPFPLTGFLSFTRAWRNICLLAAQLALIQIIMLLTRGVWLAFVSAALATIVLSIVFHRRISVPNKVLRRLAFVCGLSVIVIAGSVVYFSRFGTGDEYKKQAAWIRDYRQGTSLVRINLWAESLDMFREHPVLGVGTGNWKIHIPQYGTKDIPDMDERLQFQRPHNDFVWVLTETGILGFIFFVALFCALIRYLIRIIRFSGDYNDQVFALSMFFAVTGYMVFSFFSYPRERIEHQVFLHLVFLSVILKDHQIFPVSSVMPGRTLYIFCFPALAIMIFAISVGIIRLNSEIHAKRAFKYRLEEDWDRTAREITRAHTAFSTVDPSSTPLLWYRGMAYYEMGRLDEAFRDFKQAYKAHPKHIHVVNNLATCYQLTGDSENAEKYYLQVLEIFPQFEDAMLNLCAIYYNAGRISEAYEVIRKLDPDSENPRYPGFLTAVLQARVDLLAAGIQDQTVLPVLMELQGDEASLMDIYRYSIDRNNDFDSLLLQTIGDRSRSVKRNNQPGN